MFRSIICAAVLIMSYALMPVCSQAAGAEVFSETPEQHEARIGWWREARFGMFIHWDMSSVAGTEISWSRKGSKPLDIHGERAGYVEDPEYDHLYERFNPTAFDAKKWVKIAQDAGMKYLVITAKHHGGFCMWDSHLTDYTIMHTPFKRDVIRELSDACRAAGLRFGIYYSPRDWHHPDYGIGDDSRYLAYMEGQLTELLTNYGKIDIIWFDSFGHGDSIKYWHADQVLALVRKLQPEAVINDRCSFFGQHVKSLQADFDTPEQKIGAYQVNREWESCMCMTPPHWSYVPNVPVVSFNECVKNLVSCATGDGNMLLDVGPTSLGEIPPKEVERLNQIGLWLAKCGQSIYSTHGGPFRNGPWGGATYSGNKIFVHLFDSAPSLIRLPSLTGKMVAFRNLTGSSVQAQEKEGRIEFVLTPDARSHPDTIVELTFEQPVTRVAGEVELK